MVCPRCGNPNVTVQVFQEQRGTTGFSVTKTRTKQVGRGCLYWLTIGWWWWMVDLVIWVVAFIPRALFALTRKRKYKSTSTTFTNTHNNIGYRQYYVCQSCGLTWQGAAPIAGNGQPSAYGQINGGVQPEQEPNVLDRAQIITISVLFLALIGYLAYYFVKNLM